MAKTGESGTTGASLQSIWINNSGKWRRRDRTCWPASRVVVYSFKCECDLRFHPPTRNVGWRIPSQSICITSSLATASIIIFPTTEAGGLFLRFSDPKRSSRSLTSWFHGSRTTDHGRAPGSPTRILAFSFLRSGRVASSRLSTSSPTIVVQPTNSTNGLGSPLVSNSFGFPLQPSSKAVQRIEPY